MCSVLLNNKNANIEVCEWHSCPHLQLVYPMTLVEITPSFVQDIQEESSGKKNRIKSFKNDLLHPWVRGSGLRGGCWKNAPQNPEKSLLLHFYSTFRPKNRGQAWFFWGESRVTLREPTYAYLSVFPWPGILHSSAPPPSCDADHSKSQTWP